MHEKERILGHSSEVFFQFGIRSVTMDDLARELGISKKTLYQHFESKDDLVAQSMEQHLEQHQKLCAGEINAQQNAIEQLLAISKISHEVLRKIRPGTIYDLQKYHKTCWNMVVQHRTEFLSAVIKANIEKGITEGLYRDNLNVKIVVKLYLTLTDAMTDSLEFPPQEYPLLDVYKEFTRYHIYGIASEKGIKFLKKIQENERAESV